MAEKIREKRDQYRINIRLEQNRRRFQERRKQFFNMQQQKKLNEDFANIFLTHLKNKQYQQLKIILENLYNRLNQNNQIHSTPILLYQLQKLFAKFVNINENNDQDYYQKIQVDQTGLIVFDLYYLRQLIEIILKIFTKINFTNCKNIEFVVDKLWIIFQSESSLNLHCLLITFSNILRQCENTYNIFLNHGLPLKIINLHKQRLKEFDQDNFNLIINFLLRQQQNPVIEVTQFFNQQYKNFFFSFAMVQLQSNDKLHFLKALEIINILVQNNKYLCEFVKCEVIVQIAHLINSNNNEICIQSLRIINNLIYHSNNCSRQLLEADLFHIIELRLYIEEHLHDNQQKQRLKLIKFIVSNSFLVMDVKLRKKIRNHHLLDKIFQSLTPASKFYNLCSIFKFFFHCMPAQVAPKYLQNYFYAVSFLDLSNPSINQTKQIKETICQIYQQSQQYWQEKYEENLVNLLQKYNLLWIITEIQ